MNEYFRTKFNMKYCERNTHQQLKNRTNAAFELNKPPTQTKYLQWTITLNGHRFSQTKLFLLIIDFQVHYVPEKKKEKKIHIHTHKTSNVF